MQLRTPLATSTMARLLAVSNGLKGSLAMEFPFPELRGTMSVFHTMTTFPLFYWFLGNLALSILYTWVYNNARGSLLIMTLLHAAQNTASVLVFIALDGIPVWGYILDAVLKCLLALVVLWFAGPARLSRRPASAETVIETR